MGELSDRIHRKSSASHQMDVLHFHYVVPFRNQRASNATGMENRGQFSYFLTLIKI